LTATFPLKGFKVIAGRYFQIIESSGDLDLPELPSCHLGDVHELPDVFAYGQTAYLPSGQSCGLTWEGRLGKASILCTNSKQETLMRGVI